VPAVIQDVDLQGAPRKAKAAIHGTLLRTKEVMTQQGEAKNIAELERQDRKVRAFDAQRGDHQGAQRTASVELAGAKAYLRSFGFLRPIGGMVESVILQDWVTPILIHVTQTVRRLRTSKLLDCVTHSHRHCIKAGYPCEDPYCLVATSRLMRIAANRAEAALAGCIDMISQETGSQEEVENAPGGTLLVGGLMGDYCTGVTLDPMSTHLRRLADDLVTPADKLVRPASAQHDIVVGRDLPTAHYNTLQIEDNESNQDGTEFKVEVWRVDPAVLRCSADCLSPMFAGYENEQQSELSASDVGTRVYSFAERAGNVIHVYLARDLADTAGPIAYSVLQLQGVNKEACILMESFMADTSKALRTHK
ncbi:hypothetical protein KIPB_011909, partial [Kipferlia bialata]